MPELKELLERVAEGVRPRSDDFERLTRVRHRRRRTRRLGTAVLALVVAAAGIGLAVVSLGGGKPGPRPIGSSGEGLYALWPETSIGGLVAEQDHVDAGRDPWRTDPGRTAEEFATTVLGWPVASARDVRRETPTRAVAAVDSCPARAATCRPEFSATATLDELGRTGPTGIWSVTKVGGSRFSLPMEPGADIPSGATFELPTSWPDGTEVHVGYVYMGQCSSSGVPDIQLVHGGRIRLWVGAVDFVDDCSSPGASRFKGLPGPETRFGPGVLSRPVDGYVYVLVAPGAALGYDPLGPWSSRTMQDFAAVPVRFVPTSPASSTPPVGTTT